MDLILSRREAEALRPCRTFQGHKLARTEHILNPDPGDSQVCFYHVSCEHRGPRGRTGILGEHISKERRETQRSYCADFWHPRGKRLRDGDWSLGTGMGRHILHVFMKS